MKLFCLLGAHKWAKTAPLLQAGVYIPHLGLSWELIPVICMRCGKQGQFQRRV